MFVIFIFIYIFYLSYLSYINIICSFGDILLNFEIFFLFKIILEKEELVCLKLEDRMSLII